MPFTAALVSTSKPKHSTLGSTFLVATPGRLYDLMEQKVVMLDEIEVAIIDEADRMADMGFLPQVRRILDKTPR